MKWKTMFPVMVFLLTPLASAQPRGQIWIGSALKPTGMHEKTGLLGGIQCGWVMLPRFTLGAGTYQLLKEVDLNQAEQQVDMRYSALELAYCLVDQMSHAWSVGIKMGMGTAKVEAMGGGPDLLTQNFYLIEPGLEYSLTLSDWLMLGAGVSWRFLDRFNWLDGKSSSILQGPAATIALRYLLD